MSLQFWTCICNQPCAWGLTHCRKCGTEKQAAIHADRTKEPVSGTKKQPAPKKTNKCDLQKKHSGQQTEAEKKRMIDDGTPIGEFCVSTFKRKDPRPPIGEDGRRPTGDSLDRLPT